jgi:hypothetical protein
VAGTDVLRVFHPYRSVDRWSRKQRNAKGTDAGESHAVVSISPGVWSGEGGRVETRPESIAVPTAA